MEISVPRGHGLVRSFSGPTYTTLFWNRPHVAYIVSELATFCSVKGNICLHSLGTFYHHPYQNKNPTSFHWPCTLSTQTMQASIKLVPPELWCSICQRLELENVCALQLRYLAFTQRTHHYFADRAFGEFYLALPIPAMSTRVDLLS